MHAALGCLHANPEAALTWMAVSAVVYAMVGVIRIPSFCRGAKHTQLITCQQPYTWGHGGKGQVWLALHDRRCATVMGWGSGWTSSG